MPEGQTVVNENRARAGSGEDPDWDLPTNGAALEGTDRDFGVWRNLSLRSDIGAHEGGAESERGDRETAKRDEKHGDLPFEVVWSAWPVVRPPYESIVSGASTRKNPGVCPSRLAPAERTAAIERLRRRREALGCEFIRTWLGLPERVPRE